MRTFVLNLKLQQIVYSLECYYHFITISIKIIIYCYLLSVYLIELNTASPKLLMFIMVYSRQTVANSYLYKGSRPNRKQNTDPAGFTIRSFRLIGFYFQIQTHFYFDIDTGLNSNHDYFYDGFKSTQLLRAFEVKGYLIFRASLYISQAQKCHKDFQMIYSMLLV